MGTAWVCRSRAEWGTESRASLPSGRAARPVPPTRRSHPAPPARPGPDPHPERRAADAHWGGRGSRSGRLGENKTVNRALPPPVPAAARRARPTTREREPRESETPTRSAMLNRIRSVHGARGSRSIDYRHGHTRAGATRPRERTSPPPPDYSLLMRVLRFFS